MLATVFAPRCSKRQTCIALTPNVRPVHPIARGRSARRMVEVIVPGPAFQRNTVPSATGPSTEISFTSGFHAGQFSRSAKRSQRDSAGAAISIAPSEKTGASRLAFTERNLSVGIVSSPKGSRLGSHQDAKRQLVQWHPPGILTPSARCSRSSSSTIRRASAEGFHSPPAVETPRSSGRGAHFPNISPRAAEAGDTGGRMGH
jgi:hypothetical protein